MRFGIRRNLQKIKWNIFGAIFRRFKIQDNKIVVDNFFGRGYGDNPKYIVDKILSEKPETTIVWLVDKYTDTSLFPKEIRLVKMNSVRSIYEYATAKVWIDNIKNNYKGRKRDGQFYLQTWHGGVSLKKVEKAVENHLSADYVQASKKDSKLIDAMISNSKWQTNDYRKNFWYDGPIYEVGLPRNDIFFGDNQKIINKVRSFFNIADYSKIILYAPTFRNNKSIEEQQKMYTVNSEKIINICANKFNSDYIFIKRVHPNIASNFKVDETDKIKDGNSYPDMQELLVAADILITDFSSSIFDFMLKSSRIFLYGTDYDDYLKNDRGLNFDIKKDLPFSFANTEAELLANIKNFNEKEENIKIENMKSMLGLSDDGTASEKISAFLIKKMYE